MNREEVYNPLEGVDYITNLLGNCPKVDCILTQLLLVNNNQVCSIIQSIENDNEYAVIIESASDLGLFQNTTSAIEAHTIVIASGMIRIQLDFDESCNSSSPMDVAVSLLHEFLHVHFYVELKKLGWDGSENTFNLYWNQFLTIKMIETGKSEHEVITEFYLLPIAEALKILNENTGNAEDYYGYVLAGLFYDGEGVTVINPFMTANYLNYQDVKEAYLTSQNVVPTIQSFNFNCP